MDNMETSVPTIMAELRAKLHQIVEFEVKDVERRLTGTTFTPASPIGSVGASSFPVPPPVSSVPLAKPKVPWPVEIAVDVEVKETEDSDEIEKSENLEGNQENNDLPVTNATSIVSRVPSKDEFKAMVQRQSSYAYAWAQGSRTQFKDKRVKRVVSMTSESCMNGVRAIGTSAYFDVFWALVIFSNAAFLGLQLTLARDVDLMFVHVTYAILFAVELLLRLLTLGLREYFVGAGWAWNWMDAVIVVSSWVDIIIEMMESSGETGVSSSIRILRLLRVSRLLRIVKTLWIVRFVGALRTLVASLVDTFKPLFWAMLLLLIIIYIAGVLFTDVVLEHIDVHKNVDPDMIRFFGTLGLSVQTLFRSISGGIDWAEAAEALRPLGELWVQLFQFYVGFCTFAVLNVMTGFFCESAIKSAEKDHENTLDNRQEFRELLTDLFVKLDDGDGQLTLAEFEKMFENETMQAFLETAEITASDAWTLFASLDVDGDHLIDVDEFTKRCLSLRGGARSMDVFALTRHNLKIREQLNMVQREVANLANAIALATTSDCMSV